jgi:leucyl aminopeptidase
MDISVKTGDVLNNKADLAVLAGYEGVALPEAVAGLLEPNDFNGEANQVVLLYPRGAVAPKRLLLFGLGKRDKATPDGLRRAAATATREAQKMRAAAITLGVNGEMPFDAEAAGQAFAEGIELGAYRYHKYRTGLTTAQKFEVKHATVFTDGSRAGKARAGVAAGQAIARGVMYARDLVNTPGYALTPAAFGGEAKSLGKQTGLKVSVLDKAQLEKGGYGGILAIGRGSANDPRFIILEHGAAKKGAPTIVLVGKGLTFDSGGLSLKPAEFMSTMKSDMGGGAAVFGAMRAVAELDLPLHVVGLVPSAENMPGANAVRPDDVVTTLSGKTVEIINTDAEGRVILADALHYAQRYKPAAIVELSTLTGAIIIALGSHAIGMMGTAQALCDQLSRAGDASAERVWQLPLWDEYKQMIKSEVADIKNIGGRPAGSITAGAFLAEFTGDIPFVHLDIAGTAFAEKPAKPYDSPGGTGVGVRLLTEFLRSYSK